ncbi:MAG: peptidoglycan editing factor PgeF [Desulfotignum sp.]|nr:peptidoglycan editing factor PgeF [Desulfotignum sp.]
MGSLPMPVRTFSHFSTCPHLVHGVFTRRGGVSRPPFDSLNVGFSSGDDSEAVTENRHRILSCLGLPRAVFLHQVHGKDVLVLAREDTPDPELIWKPGHPATGKVLTGDAVVTDLTQLALVIQVADCQAVMLADPRKKVIANVHSGWRGSIENIIGRCVDVMVHRFGCDPRQILAGISPSLGPCCAQFIHFRKEIPETLWRYKLPDRDYFDFWALSVDQLRGKGLLSKHIMNMSECTRCRPDLFFSYRQAGQTGRFACAIGLA